MGNDSICDIILIKDKQSGALPLKGSSTKKNKTNGIQLVPSQCFQIRTDGGRTAIFKQFQKHSMLLCWFGLAMFGLAKILRMFNHGTVSPWKVGKCVHIFGLLSQSTYS
jgi:hypothetical protein